MPKVPAAACGFDPERLKRIDERIDRAIAAGEIPGTDDQTGLVWINPSPNTRSLTEAILSSGVGWLGATNLATGRGTDTPFECMGAPWIDPVRFTRALSAAGVPGGRFVPIWFVPGERQ